MTPLTRWEDVTAEWVRDVLVEAADGTRFELQLRREDLAWRVKRVWRAAAAA